MRLRDVPGQRHHHGKGQFSGGDGVARRRIHHHDAPGSGVIHIHIIHTHTGPPHGTELGGLVHYLRRDLGGRPNHDGLGCGEEFIGEPPVHHGDLKFRAGFQCGHAFRGNIIANEYLHRRAQSRDGLGQCQTTLVIPAPIVPPVGPPHSSMNHEPLPLSIRPSLALRRHQPCPVPARHLDRH